MGSPVRSCYSFSDEEAMAMMCVVLNHDYAYPSTVQILIKHRDKTVKDLKVSYIVKPLTCNKY